MSEWTSMSVKESTKERFDELNDGRTKDEFIQHLMDAWEGDESVGSSPPANANDFSPVNNDVAEKLDRIEERMKDFAVTENQQRVIARIDDHETEMKSFLERELGR